MSLPKRDEIRHFCRVVEFRADGAILLRRFDRDHCRRDRFAIMQRYHAAKMPRLAVGDIVEVDIWRGAAFRPSRVLLVNVDEREYAKRGKRAA